MADPIFSAYKLFPVMLSQFISGHRAAGKDIAQAVYMNAYRFYMMDLKNAGVLRMNFFVFTKAQAAAIEQLAKEKFANFAILDPFAEALFMSQRSKWDIDQYFNLYFAPVTGLFNTDAGITAYKIAGKTLGLSFNNVSELVEQVKVLSLEDYALFTASVVGGIKSLNPEGYAQGVDRFKDHLNSIYTNPNNFRTSANTFDRDISNTQIILAALNLPKDNLIFQDEYLKNLDLSLYTRMLIANDSEKIPFGLERLDVVKAIKVWRHNSRVRLGDISGTLESYPVVPESKNYAKYLVIAVVSVVAIALVAPYALNAMSVVTAKATALGSAAMTKAGTLLTMATDAAVKSEVAEIENKYLEELKGDTRATMQQTQTELNTTRAVIAPSAFGTAEILSIVAVVGLILIT